MDLVTLAKAVIFTVIAFSLLGMNVGAIFLYTNLPSGAKTVHAALPEPREYLRQGCEKLKNCDFALLDAIIECESNWRMVKNATSSAYGYFQIIDATERTTPQYKQGERKFDAYTNIDMGLYLYSRYGSSPWNESRKCWHWKHKQSR